MQILGYAILCCAAPFVIGGLVVLSLAADRNQDTRERLRAALQPPQEVRIDDK
jgi:hypothetical protein